MSNGYLFRWNKIPGEDYSKLELFLVNRFDIDIKDASFTKKDNVIEIKTGGKSITFELDEINSVVTLKINGQELEKFDLAKEMYVYEQQNVDELQQQIYTTSEDPTKKNKNGEKYLTNKNVEKDIEELKEEWDDIDTWVNTASENGLFKVQDQIKVDEILCKLKEAKVALDNSNISECRKLLSSAQDTLYEAMEHAPRMWRILYKYAIHIWAYLASVLVTIFLFYYYDLDSLVKDSIGISQLALDATVWGVIGSIFRGIWWLWYRVNRNEFRKIWLTWYLSAPFIGGILGALIFITAHAGLVIIQGGTQTSNNLNHFVIIAGAAFAGFKWKWAIEKISQLMGEKEQ
ncbi:MAG: hypothetical protein KatS3mg003_1227 [Candidatus Nitrosocaldaceae archaeon]|nr:MAG: hypothetical protein KatS3mg003_1227 [Candidatus Nitrosocaldaceae archaeon]